MRETGGGDQKSPATLEVVYLAEGSEGKEQNLAILILTGYNVPKTTGFNRNVWKKTTNCHLTITSPLHHLTITLRSSSPPQTKVILRIVVLSCDGFYQAGEREKIEKGEGVLVLPLVDARCLQFEKDIMQELCQIAVSAVVVLRL